MDGQVDNAYPIGKGPSFFCSSIDFVRSIFDPFWRWVREDMACPITAKNRLLGTRFSSIAFLMPCPIRQEQISICQIPTRDILRSHCCGEWVVCQALSMGLTYLLDT